MAARKELRVAIVGSGISGISAAYLLSNQQDHPNIDYKVTLIEASGRLGGHTHSVTLPPLHLHGEEDNLSYINPDVGRADRGTDGKTLKPKQSVKPAAQPKAASAAADGSGKASKVKVDVGFIVCNPVTYPNFLAMMQDLKVKMMDSNMSFSVCRNFGDFEWAGKNLQSVFCQWQNIFSPSMYRMIFEVLRFNQEASRLAEEADMLEFEENGEPKQGDHLIQDHPLANMTFRNFFEKNGYSSFFYENYILPMTAAIWSSPADIAFAQFPMLTLIRFMRNHCLLQVGKRPVWKTVANGSESYIEPALKKVDKVLVGTKIVSITRPDNPDEPVILVDQHGVKREFDHVIFATHSDQALRILGKDATEMENQVLGSIRYSKNTAYLHRDFTLMPSREKAWSSWNYLSIAQEEARSSSMTLTYWMNKLQPFIDSKVYGDVFVTLNPPFPPLPEQTLSSFEYDHPVYSPATIKAQEQLPLIQNQKRVTFTGAWTNYGFHEDGCTSGLLAAVSLGAKPIFDIALNGGYPTTRKPIPPLAHLVSSGLLNQGKGQGFTPLPPKHIPHASSSSKRLTIKNGARLFVFGVFGLIVALFVNLIYQSYTAPKEVFRSHGHGYKRGKNGQPNLVW